jgi:leucyl-tRNA---protein transferase
MSLAASPISCVNAHLARILPGTGSAQDPGAGAPVEHMSRPADRRGRMNDARPLDGRDTNVGPTLVFPCSYHDQRMTKKLVIEGSLPPGGYQRLMDLNYRRCGDGFYRPACPGCTACRTIRLPVRLFRPSRAQRRCWGANRDVTVSVGPPTPTLAKHALYFRYLQTRHDGKMTGSETEFRHLYLSPIHTVELSYHLDGRLLGACLVDVEPRAASAVYCYFDPDETQRSLGVLNVLAMIDLCRRRLLTHLYLGYYVDRYPRTHYLAGYRPHQILRPDGSWWTGFTSERPTSDSLSSPCPWPRDQSWAGDSAIGPAGAGYPY